MEKLEVSELLPRLSGTENDQVEALKELHRIAVWSRGSTLPRGDLTEAARTRLSESDEKRLLFCLEPEQPVEIQRRAALALGHSGGPNSVKPLARLLNRAHGDSATRSYCLSALRTIGGREAAETIIDTLDRTSGRDVEVMNKALSAIVDLVTGGSESDLEDATVIGSSRAREQRLPSAVAQSLKRTLDRIIRGESLPRRVRFRAREVLNFLTETGVVANDRTVADSGETQTESSWPQLSERPVHEFTGAEFLFAPHSLLRGADSAPEPQKPREWEFHEYDLHVQGTPQPGGEYRFEAASRKAELENAVIRFALTGVTTGKPNVEFDIKLDYHSAERDRWEGSEQISLVGLTEDSRLVLQGLDHD